MSAFGMRQRRLRTRREQQKKNGEEWKMVDEVKMVENTMKLKEGAMTEQHPGKVQRPRASSPPRVCLRAPEAGNSVETPPPQSPSGDGASGEVEQQQQELSYEEKRRQNIARNKALMKDLGLQDTATRIDKGKESAKAKKRRKDDDEDFEVDEEMEEEEAEATRTGGRKAAKTAKQATAKKGKIRLLQHVLKVLKRLETSSNEWHYGEVIAH
eukprot:764329-Hanusia_phi.AAC.3